MAADVAERTLTKDQARELTDRIAVAASDLWELVKQAYVEKAWAALGYTSWDEYVEAELGSTRFRLPREERTEVVTSLRDAGLSIRAIASVTGDSKSTVDRVIHDAEEVEPPPEPVYIDAERIDIDEDVTVPNGTVDVPERSLGRDGREQPKRKPPKPKQEKPKSELTLLSVARPDPADVNVFAHGATAGFGTPDLGAAVVADQVQWFAAGSYDDISPDQARFLAACLLAAADIAEKGE